MNPAVVSLLALLIAIILSMTSRINVRLVAIALAWLVGVYVAGFKAEAVMSGFPVTSPASALGPVNDLGGRALLPVVRRSDCAGRWLNCFPS